MDDEKELMRIKDEKYHSGRLDAFQQLETDLRHRAGAAFSQHNDEKAKLLRQLSIEIGKMALDEQKRLKELQPVFGFGV